MSHAVAVAVARLLINHVLDFGSKLVRMRLIGILTVVTPKLLFADERRQLGSIGRRSDMECRYSRLLLLRACPGSRDCERQQERKYERQPALQHAVLRRYCNPKLKQDARGRQSGGLARDRKY